jgi:hypothetical protein
MNWLTTTPTVQQVKEHAAAHPVFNRSEGTPGKLEYQETLYSRDPVTKVKVTNLYAAGTWMRMFHDGSPEVVRLRVLKGRVAIQSTAFAPWSSMSVNPAMWMPLTYQGLPADYELNG